MFRIAVAALIALSGQAAHAQAKWLTPPQPEPQMPQAEVITLDQCAPSAIVADRLSGGFGETVAYGGLRSPTQMIELWANDETGTFSIILRRANGLRCIVTVGRFGVRIAPPPNGEGV